MPEFPAYPNEIELRTYHMVWGTYGSRIPGTLRVSIRHGGARHPIAFAYAMRTLERMIQSDVLLESDERVVVERAIRNECVRQGW